MSNERLRGLDLIALENEMLKKVVYEDLIDDFAWNNALGMETLYMINIYVWNLNWFYIYIDK